MSANDAGFVKLYRSLLGHTAFRNDAEAMAFAWMVMRASWRRSKVRYKDRAISLQRGQLAVSVRDMAASMDRDKAWVERLWKRLKSETMIETANDAGVSVVTICNYSTFQGERDTGETVLETLSETGARQARDTEQRNKEIKNTSVDKSTSVKVVSVAFELPSRIPAEPWAGWIEMRVKMKKRPTVKAMQLAIRELDKLAEQGWPPGEVLDHCTMNGYQGIFPPKGNRNERNSDRQTGVHDPMVRTILRRQTERASGSTDDFCADAGDWREVG